MASTAILEDLVMFAHMLRDIVIADASNEVVFVAKSTVQTHRRKIISKLKLSSTTELVRYALQRKMVKQLTDGNILGVKMGAGQSTLAAL